MYSATKTAGRREAFTLIELLVVIAIILVIAALAAAFAPNVSDSQNLTRSIDQLEQWLLTAKMRAKRDQLATGIRFVPAQGDLPGTISQCQYIQQPDALAGGWVSATSTPGSVLYSSGPPATFLTGSILQSAAGGQALFVNADFTMGNNALLVQAGDFLEVRDGGVYQIATIVPPVSPFKLPDNSPTASGAMVTATTIQLISTAPGTFDASLNVASPTTNYRILRQPRILIGEAPLQLPNNFAVEVPLPPPGNPLGGNVAAGPSGNFEILFSPSGAVVGTNAGNGKILMIVHDVFGNPATAGVLQDNNRAGIVGVQCRTGFIGAYSLAPGLDPFAFVESGRESGL